MALRDHPTYKGGIGWYHKPVGETDSSGFFAISGVKEIPRDSRDGTGEMVRCDSADHGSNVSYGPYGFHRWNASTGLCSCGSAEQPEPQMGHHQITLRNISKVNAVIEALPYGYVLYFELHDEQLEEECIQMSHSDCARTLQELFRLMLEWEYANKELGSSELIAETCSGMLQVLDMPSTIREFLLLDVPDEKVAKFIKGDPAARQRANVNSIPDMSDEFSSWLEEKITSSRPIGGYRQGGQ